MSKAFGFQVITPERVVWESSVESLVVPGVRGYIGFLWNHAPMVVHMRAGVVKFRTDKGLDKMAISGGFLEVTPEKAVLLADTAELASEIDVERARRAKERALKRLRSREEGIDYTRARAALERAIARLRAASKD